MKTPIPEYSVAEDARHNPALAASLIVRMDAHEAADEVVQGFGWEDGKGCAIGCMFNQYDHALGARTLNVPENLLYLVDAIHEGLPLEQARKWPGKALRAMLAASDDAVKHAVDRVALLRMDRLLALPLGSGTEPYVAKVRAAIEGVKHALVLRIGGDESAESAARSAAESAESAASAAWSVAWSAECAESAESAESAEIAAWSAESAASAARSAAESAESAESVESAESAESAAWSAAWSAARSAASAARSAARSAESAAWSAESAAWSAESEQEASALIALLEAA